ASSTTSAPAVVASAATAGSSVTTTALVTLVLASTAVSVSAANARASSGRTSPTASASRDFATSGRLTGMITDQGLDTASMVSLAPRTSPCPVGMLSTCAAPQPGYPAAA